MARLDYVHIIPVAEMHDAVLGPLLARLAEVSELS